MLAISNKTVSDHTSDVDVRKKRSHVAKPAISGLFIWKSPEYTLRFSSLKCSADLRRYRLVLSRAEKIVPRRLFWIEMANRLKVWSISGLSVVYTFLVYFKSKQSNENTGEKEIIFWYMSHLRCLALHRFHLLCLFSVYKCFWKKVFSYSFPIRWNFWARLLLFLE